MFQKTVPEEEVAFYMMMNWQPQVTEDGKAKKEGKRWVLESDRPYPFGGSDCVEVDVTDEQRQMEKHNCTRCGQRDMVLPAPMWSLCLSTGEAYHAHDHKFPPPIELPKEKVQG